MAAKIRRYTPKGYRIGDVTLDHRRAVAVLAASAVAVSLAACGSTASKDQGSPASSAGQSAAPAPSNAHNEDDVLFAQLMIPHHEQAVVLAAMVPDRSVNAAVRTLAAQIASAQQPEIATMKDQLKGWGIDPAEMPHESGHAGMSMQGMVDDDTILKLRGLSGADFDMLWLQSMIGHHQGAIQMAKVEAEAGKSPEMMVLARSIITTQQAEIDQMKQMLQTSGG